METFNPKTNTVVCRKYQQDLPKMPHTPFPTAKGQEIQDTVSHKAWQEWLNLQTMLINEKHLSLINPDAKSYLTEQRELFFDNGDFEQPTGWSPAES